GVGFPPTSEDAVEGTDEEVPRPTGGVDQTEALAVSLVDTAALPIQTEFVDSGLKGVVEDELLNKLRRLKERVVFADVFRQVLVEVPEEPGVPVGVGEVMPDVAVIPDLAPKSDEVLSRL